MKLKQALIITLVLLSPSQSNAGGLGEVFGRVAGEIVFRLLIELPIRAALNHSFKSLSIGSEEYSTKFPRDKPKLPVLTEKGKMVNFLFSVKFVLDVNEVKDCALQKVVHHRSFFPWFVNYPKEQYMNLWYNNQTIKELAKKNLANVVLLKGQEKNLIRVKQEAALYTCPKLKPISIKNCKWIKSENMKIANRSLVANKQATIKMMNKAADLKGNHIGFITRTGKSPMGMQKFSYEVLNCQGQ